ncbi:MAG: GTP diphosphokinase, partial [Pseudomonadota bacterium]|nr:GTP diphosphokinase [Pseudomonadota bacterium]
MVKVREDQPLNAEGRVDIDQWVARLQEDVKLADASELAEACRLAESLEQTSERPHKSWLKDGSSFRMGLEMADILGELRLDQTAIEAAVLYR